MDGVAAVKHKCTCERNGKGHVTKRNEECPVRHRGAAVGSLKPAERKTMSDAQMAVARVREELRQFDNKMYKAGLEGVREIFWPYLASARIAVETIRRYLDGE